MKFVIQRVLEASTTIIETDDAGCKTEYISGKIQKGFMVLCGIMESDTMEIADKMVQKLISMRIFEDENGKTNLDLNTVGGELMIVSQFTLCADVSHGNRPSFINAGSPAHAEELYDYTVAKLRETAGCKVETGSFGAEMKVRLLNDGPFTIWLNSDELK